MKLALEALIDDDDNANDTDANDTNNDCTNDNNKVIVVVVILVIIGVGVIDIVGIIGDVIIINVLCFGSTGLYWSYLEGGPWKTEG